MEKVMLFIEAYKYVWYFMAFAGILAYIVENNKKTEEILLKISEKIIGEKIYEDHTA